MNKALITIKNLNIQLASLKNGRTSILKIHDLTFSPGDVVYIQGSNGSGKSTFMKFLSGQLDSTQYVFTAIDSNKDIIANVSFSGEKEFVLSLLDQKTKQTRYFDALNKNTVYFEGDTAGNWFNYLFLSTIQSVLTNEVINKTNNSSTIVNINKQLIKDHSNNEWDDKIFSVKPIEELEFYNEINNLSPLEKISKLLQRKYEKLIPPDADYKFKSLVKRVSRNRFFKLSAGQKQIVMLYRSFFSIDQLKPALIFLDEPLNYLDYLNKVVIVKDIEKIVFDRHSSTPPPIIFIVSHAACFSFLHSKESYLPNKRKVKLLVIQHDHTLNEVKELQVRKGILPCEN